MTGTEIISKLTGRVTGYRAFQYANSLIERFLGRQVDSFPEDFGMLERTVDQNGNVLYSLSNPKKLWGMLTFRNNRFYPENRGGIIMTDAWMTYEPKPGDIATDYHFDSTYAHIDPSVPQFDDDYFDQCLHGLLNLYLSTTYPAPDDYEDFFDRGARSGILTYGWYNKDSMWETWRSALVMEAASAIIDSAREHGFIYIDRPNYSQYGCELSFSHGIQAKIAMRKSEMKGDAPLDFFVDFERSSVAASDVRDRWTKSHQEKAQDPNLYERVRKDVDRTFAEMGDSKAVMNAESIDSNGDIDIE